MWDQIKSANRAAQEIFGMIKRKPEFAPAFSVSQFGFPTANHAGREVSNIISRKYGHNSGASYNAAMVHLFREAAKDARCRVDVRIIRRGQKPKVRPVADPENYWKNLMPRDAEVILTISRRDGPLRNLNGQAKPV